MKASTSARRSAAACLFSVIICRVAAAESRDDSISDSCDAAYSRTFLTPGEGRPYQERGKCNHDSEVSCQHPD
jgi:hypothetical protein